MTTTEVADTLFGYLRNALYASAEAVLDVDALPEAFRTLGEGLQYFVACVQETRAFAKALSKGDLTAAVPSSGNEMAAPLKALHASLRHLTWQTQQVAKGDYKQRVHFLGDFAEAFNLMVQQLDVQRSSLLQEIEKSKAKTLALSRSNSLMENISNLLPQWIIIIHKETDKVLFTNRAGTDMLHDATLGQSLRDWLSQITHRMTHENETYAEEFILQGKNVTYHISAMVFPLHWHEQTAFAFVLADISTEKLRTQALEDVAYRDPLTQMFNRHYGMKLLNQWLNEGISFSLCFVDLDNLKYVNDKFGHAEGDAYILSAVDILRCFSPDVILCRLGGDEFMLLAEHWSAAEAEATLETLRERLRAHSNIPTAPYIHSMSYGVIEATPNDTLSSGDLLSMADEKMYAYKRSHKAERPSNGN
ncbi:MAG: diguanylate cyclase [Oscillospiraceae bacterium]|jgi:diguanylate cyclase (GGDEF)-like protein|nr:diguanylate cyclase [Oscillospiraceae bacterium]